MQKGRPPFLYFMRRGFDNLAMAGGPSLGNGSHFIQITKQKAPITASINGDKISEYLAIENPSDLKPRHIRTKIQHHLFFFLVSQGKY